MTRMQNQNLIVKYDNSFNKTSLSLLTKVQSNVLMSVLQRMGKEFEKDKHGNDCYVAKYTFEEIRLMTNSKSLQTKKIKEIFDQLLDTKVEIFEDSRYTKANLFSHYTLTDRSTAKITLSSALTNKLITDEEKYTILSLDEYVSLPNNYSKEMYRLLRQFRHSGIIYIKKEDLRRALKPPKSYLEYDFIRRIIEPAIENNKEYFDNLKIYLKNKSKLPNVIKITFEPHKKKKINKAEMNDDLIKYLEENV